MSRTSCGLVGLAVGFVIAAAGESMAIEKLDYRVLEQDGAFELRRIEPHVIAETFAEGRFEDVGSIGFRRLFRYIGGANRSNEKIAMTAPVDQKRASEKIAMTAPVGQERVGDRYRISFVMPREYSLETLPEPDDPLIHLSAVPARTVAAIRYSGFWSRSRYEGHEHKLRAWIERKGLETVSEPVWARYDPPFMPWLFRRNEIWFEVRDTASANVK